MLTHADVSLCDSQAQFGNICDTTQQLAEKYFGKSIEYELVSLSAKAVMELEKLNILSKGTEDLWGRGQDQSNPRDDTGSSNYRVTIPSSHGSEERDLTTAS